MLINNIWVINLDKSVDRLEKITKNLQSLNLKFNRFSAIYGKDVSQEYLDENVNSVCSTLLCNYGIIGCAASHKQLWKQLVESDQNAYVILEDDALLNQKSVDILNKLEPYIEKYNIDYLSLICIHHGCVLKDIEFKIDNIEFGKPYFPLQATGYIITKNGAKKLLEYISKTTYHVDFEILYVKLMHGLNFYASSPSVINMDETGTTIGAKRTCLTIELMNKLGLSYIGWAINAPLITLKLKYEINIITILLIILLLLNIFKIKNDIIYWFIFFELFVLYSIYL